MVALADPAQRAKAAVASSPTGVLVVDKPQGITSHDVVSRIRRLYRTKRVGHLGTLDPLATGVLVLCLGQATRIAEYLAGCDKEYVAGASFGATSSTEDSTGDILSETDATQVTSAQVEHAMMGFRGDILQTPPMVSALHHEGRRLYEIAREGGIVDRPPRPVTISELDLCSFQPGARAIAELRIVCSGGTYIRTLIADIGATLGVGGVMTSLRRTRVGPFQLEDSRTLQTLQAASEAESLPPLQTIAEALRDLHSVRLSTAELSEVRMGRAIAARSKMSTSSTPILLLDEAGVCVGVGEVLEGAIQPRKVFAMEDRS